MVGGGDELVMDPQVMMSDLDDHLLQLVLSKMTITEQLAVTRVCHRFNDSAFKLTSKIELFGASIVHKPRLRSNRTNLEYK